MCGDDSGVAACAVILAVLAVIVMMIVTVINIVTVIMCRWGRHRCRDCNSDGIKYGDRHINDDAVDTVRCGNEDDNSDADVCIVLFVDIPAYFS